MPVHEIIVFAASEAFIVNPIEILAASRTFFEKVDGCHRIYGGVAEGTKIGYVVIAWESFEHHQAIKTMDGFPQILGLAPIFGQGDSAKVYHIDFVGDPEAAIASNVTEVLALTLKEGKTRADLAEVFESLTAKLTAEEGCTKTIAWGETREEPGRLLFLLLGWKHLKGPLEANIKGHSSSEASLECLIPIVDLEILKVHFKKVL